MRNLIFFTLLFSGCTTFYENGHKVAVIGGDVDGFSMKTPRGTIIIATKIRHSIIIQKVGAAVSQGIISAGATTVTGGALP